MIMSSMPEFGQQERWYMIGIVLNKKKEFTGIIKSYVECTGIAFFLKIPPNTTYY
jgi:hypothetical protein